MLKLWLEESDGARLTVDLADVEAAGPACRTFIDKHSIGARLFRRGLVYQEPFRDAQDVVATVSFNGSISRRGEAHVEEYLHDILPAHRKEGFATLPPWSIKQWVDSQSSSPIAAVFMTQFAGDPVADALVALDHQLWTDSDLEQIAGAAKYEALRLAIRSAMAKKLGFSGYRRS